MSADTAPASARPVRVRLWLSAGARPEIDAYPTPVPGLVIHRTFGQPDDIYTLTHAASGVALAAAMPSPEAALGLAVDLGPYADWTRPVDVAILRAHGPRLARRWGWNPDYVDRIGVDSARAAGAVA